VKPPRLFAALVALSALVLAATGCSRVALGYRTADFLIERYADDYLALARHREQELPFLAAFFDTAYRDAQGHFDAANMACLLDAFEGLYRRNMGMAAALAAPLLASVTPSQVRGLEAKLRKDDADEAKEDKDSVRGRESKRAKRFSASVEWWIGPLTEAQSALVAQVTAAMPDSARAWEDYRRAKRAGLIRLLHGHANEGQIHRYLTDWVVEHRDLPPALRQVHQEIRRRITELFVGLDATFSPGQRAHLVDRLRDLRDDFMGLQAYPHMAPTSCTGGEAARSAPGG
jgi:hypothetical protein